MIIMTVIYFIFIIFFFKFFDKFSSIINIYDAPDGRKFHETETSLAGGVFIFICLYVYLFFETVFNLINNQLYFQLTTEYVSFFFISLSFFLTGFIDDKKNLSSNKKIIIFLSLIIFIVNLDPKLNLTILNFSFMEKKILLQNFSKIFTIMCIFIFINSLNMYDGSNGQLGIYSIIFISYLAYKTSSYSTLNLIVPLVFFLYLNLKNVTFAGNSGSYFLGFLLSYIVLKIYNNNSSLFMYADEIALMMFYPVVDLLRLFFFRIYNNNNPLFADRNHIHHILQNMQFSNKKIQLILLLINSFPLVMYEVTKLNILLFFLMNTFIYCLIVSKKIIFLK